MSIEIKPEVRSLADTLKKTISLDTKTGLATITETAYADNLPADVTVEQVKSLAKHNTLFIAAAGLALGEAAVPVMAKNADISVSELAIPVGNGDSIGITFQRSKFTGAPGGEKTEKFGILSAEYTMRGARNIGDLGKVRSHLAELATAKFAAKK